ncbi:CapA family protein [Ammonicoccus fulvus]|uniref:CapA family protein n=1 Tax=Ammonicoccus fulvus TaxID=3138240 RepID=A0ABZ3FRP5_9ACTN
MRGAWIPGLLVVFLAACTGGTAPAPEPSASSSAPRPSVAPTTPSATVPLVLAVHHSRGAVEIAAGTLDDLQEGRIRDWADLGQPGGALSVATGSPAEALEAVTRDRNTIAVVPATSIDERVRVAEVDGVHPLRNPQDYPVRIAAGKLPVVTTITITGDIMLGRRVGRAYAGNPRAPFEPFAERLAGADLTLGNFEATLSNNGRATQGGDSFHAAPAMLEGLHRAGFDGVSLANNHLGDYGDRAMLETFEGFDSAGLAYFGAGPDLQRARAPWIAEHDGVRIAFLGTESIGETPAAGDARPGTNRLDMPPRTGPLDRAALDRIAGDIAAAAEAADVVIVIPHWGAQYTHQPEDSQRLAATRFAEAGDDLVIGGHPHWVQGWEAIGDTTVVHSLGNFVFDMQFSRQVQEGIFVEIVLWGDRVVAVEPVPYVIRDHIPRPAGEQDAARILAEFRSTSTGPYAG